MGTEVQLMNDEFELEVDDGVDLYDDMITSSARRDSETQDGGTPPSPDPVTTNNVSAGNGLNNGKGPPTIMDSHRGDGPRDSIVPLRKFQVYIGNLTWWTSDQDVQDAVLDIGVADFIEVKFYENRANGQSKGYCVLTVGSENSLKLLHDKLPKKELHSQFPVVTPPTKQALNQFEAQAKTRPSGPGNNEKGQQGGGGGEMNMNMMGNSPMGMGRMMGPGGPRGPPRGMGPPPGMGGPPGHRNMGPMGSPGGYCGPPRPMMPPNMGPMQGPPRMPMMNDQFYQQGPPQGPMGPRGPGPGPMPPRDGWPRSPMNQFSPHGPHGPPGPHMNSPNGPPNMQGPMRGPMPHQMQTPPQAPAPHMNPAFFHQQQGPNSSPMQAGPLMGPGPYNSPGPQGPYQGQGPPIDHRSSPAAPAVPDVEFEEIMSRNRTVSSSAISRAVSDAATGEFASAIETLVTAISLISQSKVAHDDRCKILVSSLRDTLHGIETKSYGGRPRESPVLERSRSRDRDRHRNRRRERSRSREYRDRSRERDRYYEYPRERSRSREYRERPREEGARPYYDERYRERERAGAGAGAEREREQRSSRNEQERPREREPEREREREVVSHRSARH